MKSIKSFKGKKIETMQDIYGGRTVNNTYDGLGNKNDKNVKNDDGCLIKHVENTGFWNWLTGNRDVTTYAGDCLNGDPDYGWEGGTQIDSN
jgi:hypothetical protein